MWGSPDVENNLSGLKLTMEAYVKCNLDRYKRYNSVSRGYMFLMSLLCVIYSISLPIIFCYKQNIFNIVSMACPISILLILILYIRKSSSRIGYRHLFVAGGVETLISEIDILQRTLIKDRSLTPPEFFRKINNEFTCFTNKAPQIPMNELKRKLVHLSKNK